VLTPVVPVLVTPVLNVEPTPELEMLAAPLAVTVGKNAARCSATRARACW